jgi:hypothetical protein
VRLLCLALSLLDTRMIHLPPEIWGPFFWHTIHITALGYPQEPSHAHKKAAKEFFESLKILIPCPICKDHYAQHLEKYPITPHLDKRSDLFRWTLLLHNEVNKTLNKPSFTEAQVIDHYSRLGKLGRSPIFTNNDFAEADSKALVRGIGIGIVVAGVASGVLWTVSR